MIKKILLALLVVVVVFVVVVSMQPDEFRVERSITIAAPDSVVFPLVNDLHNWDLWSPWAKLDPNMVTVFEGPSEGVGAVQSWSGNSDVGKGKMTILDNDPYRFVRIQLEFIEPFASSSISDFNFVDQDGQTTVNWVMEGPHNFISKAMCLFIDMDAAIGGDFEKGLAAMKTAAESR